MPYLDGLPVATSVAGTDIIAVDQGGTAGLAGTATTRQTTVSAILQLGVGPVTGPGSSVDGDIVTFNGTTGRVLADSGVAIARVVRGPTSSTSGNLPEFSNTAGNGVSDSGISASAITPQIASIAALRASTTTTAPNPTVYVIGYRTGADGGEGPFWYNASDTTSSDNGGTIIVDTSGRRWYRESSGLPFSVKWFGATGNGSTDDSVAFAATFAAGQYGIMPTATYLLTTGATLPFNKTLVGMPGSKIASSGAGLTQSGPTVKFGDNPSGQTTWTSTAQYTYSGLAVDFGGYGPTQFGTTGGPIAITGKIVVPANSNTDTLNGFAVAGYAKNSATVTNGVGVYAEGNCEATGAKVWGFNSRSMDNGFQTALWGAEIDINVTNAATQVIGYDATGGSSVEPAVSPAFRVGPLGAFSTPFKRWSHGLQVSDGSAVTGIELGTVVSGVFSGSMPLTFAYNNSSNARAYAGAIQADGGGNLAISLDNFNPAMYLTTPNSVGVQTKQIVLQNTGIGFFGTNPAAKQTVTGSKGGNAALASLISALALMGLITDTTT